MHFPPPFLPCFSQDAEMQSRRREPARFLDARPLYFRPGLESASNSIILVSRIPLLSTAFLWIRCIFIRGGGGEGGRQTDRRISRSRAKDLLELLVRRNGREGNIGWNVGFMIAE